jgi:alpha-beta hydrolase superfamily lysophospholipase
LPDHLRLVHDLALALDHTQSAYPGLPLVLLGHSLGGLVAASLVARKLRPVDALVLSSPALDPGLSGFQKLLLRIAALLPELRLPNGINANHISHDSAVVQAYRDDPLNHAMVSGRLALFLAREGAQVQAAAPQWSVPTLLLYAGQDHLVRPQASRDFAQAVPPAQLQAHCFEALYHEVFNEVDPQPVFDALQAWLVQRYPER